MPILTSFPQAEWLITLNRIERSQVLADPQEESLKADDFSIRIPTPDGLMDVAVTNIEITAPTTRRVTTDKGMFELKPEYITITNHPGMVVTAARKTVATEDPDTTWNLILNRAINNGIGNEPPLRPNEINIFTANNRLYTERAVTSIIGTGLKRTILLSDTAILPNFNLRISTHIGMNIVSIQSPIYISALESIRKFVSTEATAQGIPDDVIGKDYLRNAEFEIYDDLGISESEYDMRADAHMPGSNELTADAIHYREKVRIATEYRTAALLVPAYPDLVRQSVLSTSFEYEVFDPSKKIQFLLKRSKDEIAEFITTDTATTGYVAKGFTRRRSLF